MGHMVFAPPSLRGDLTHFVLCEVRDSNGTLVAYRANFETVITTIVDRAVLPDGRLAPVEIVGREELPWNLQSGEIASGLIVDPAATPAVGSVDGRNGIHCWQHGATGEVMTVAEVVTELTFGSRRPIGPDPALRVRVIDNWGQPRAPTDPQLKIGYLRWLKAAHPNKASEVFEAATTFIGTLPSATSATQLALACGVSVPFFAPEPLESVPKSLGAYDPRRRPGRPEPWCGKRTAGGLWQWRCICGELRGSKHAGMTCGKCNRHVYREQVSEPQHEIQLPVPVMHPWRRGLIAALLGLTESELSPIVVTEDCSELSELTASAFENPYRNLYRRIAQTGDKKIVAMLFEHHAELDQALRHGLQNDDLWLRKLPVLSPRLLFDGYRLGAGDLIQSPLTRKYRSISSISQLTSDRVGMLPLLRQTQWIELQRYVDRLFGSFENVEPGTLAEYWLRVWPTTSESSRPLSVSGLCADISADEIRAAWTRVFWPEAILDGERPFKLGIVVAREPVVLPQPPHPLIDPVNMDAWVERGAWAELIDRHLIWLTAVLLGIDGDLRVAQAVRAVLPEEVADCPSIGRILLRELVRGLSPPSGHPSKMFGLVLRKIPLRLPRADLAAAEALEAKLAGTVACDDRPAQTSLHALTIVLGGFWRGPASLEHPSGWLWASSEHGVPKDFRRVVPNIESAAWKQWPDFDLMVNPVRALARGSAVQPVSSSVRAWFGMDAGEVPVDLDWGQNPVVAVEEISEAPVQTAASGEEDVSLETPSVGPELVGTSAPIEHQVTVFSGSLLDWIASQG